MPKQHIQTTLHYSATARRLHWLLAALIIGMFGLGIYMINIPFSSHKLQIYSWHKWIGVSIFLLVLAHLIWRFFKHPPALPASMSPMAQKCVDFALGEGMWAAFDTVANDVDVNVTLAVSEN